MSRSGYGIWDDGRGHLYRANVDRALAGKRGQAFLRELLAALDALPEKKLATNDFETADGVCALGAVGRARGNQCWLTLDDDYYFDVDMIGKHFGIASCMAAEIMWENDEHAAYWMGMPETPEQRFARVRRWVESNIK